MLAGGIEVFGTLIPDYNLFIMLFGPLIAVLVWLMLTRTTMGRMIRAAALDREMLGALGAMSAGSIPGCSRWPRFWPGCPARW